MWELLQGMGNSWRADLQNDQTELAERGTFVTETEPSVAAVAAGPARRGRGGDHRRRLSTARRREGRVGRGFVKITVENSPELMKYSNPQTPDALWVPKKDESATRHTSGGQRETGAEGEILGGGRGRTRQLTGRGTALGGGQWDPRPPGRTAQAAPQVCSPQTRAGQTSSGKKNGVTSGGAVRERRGTQAPATSETQDGGQRWRLAA